MNKKKLQKKVEQLEARCVEEREQTELWKQFYRNLNASYSHYIERVDAAYPEIAEAAMIAMVPSPNRRYQLKRFRSRGRAHYGLYPRNY